MFKSFSGWRSLNSVDNFPKVNGAHLEKNYQLTAEDFLNLNPPPLASGSVNLPSIPNQVPELVYLAPAVNAESNFHH